VSLFIGTKIDEYFSTSPLFTLIFSLIGLGGMIKIIFYNVKRASHTDKL
jgi:F0F1-type ATP synthase assembly protein I